MASCVIKLSWNGIETAAKEQQQSTGGMQQSNAVQFNKNGSLWESPNIQSVAALPMVMAVNTNFHTLYNNLLG